MLCAVWYCMLTQLFLSFCYALPSSSSVLFFFSSFFLSQVSPFPAATLHGERRREAGGRVIRRLHSSLSFVGIIIFVFIFVVFVGSMGEDEGTGAIHTVASLAGSVHAVFQVKEKLYKENT